VRHCRTGFRSRLIRVLFPVSDEVTVMVASLCVTCWPVFGKSLQMGDIFFKKCNFLALI